MPSIIVSRRCGAWSGQGKEARILAYLKGTPSETEAPREADIDQHIAFSKSVDKGVTWTPPVVLAGSPNKKNPALV